MHRVTITVDDDLMKALDAYMAGHGYENRSEAMRDLVRDRLDAERLAKRSDGPCVATLSYVYNHEERELAKRLVRAGHDHHDLTVATLHVHLDRDRCLEVSVLKGAARDVAHFADHVLAERGVQSGELHVVPVD
ncbi:MAG: nickel-responsive transcriptional regulator NikR [Alphaproteobacteria bacterium]|nr:nickel-responsive transcriptional regulator NikR [Alphaproteobacteria bacterium]